MDSQFRCGKCGKPISSKFTKCIDCGSLGPHTYVTSAAGPTEIGRGPQSPQRRDSSPAGRGERQSPATRGERYSEPMDIPAEPPSRSAGQHDADDSRFPAGMRHRSPILDHIEDMDSGEQKEPKKRQRKEREQDEEYDFDEKPAAKKHYKWHYKYNNRFRTNRIYKQTLVQSLQAAALVFIDRHVPSLPSGPRFEGQDSSPFSVSSSFSKASLAPCFYRQSRPRPPCSSPFHR